MNKQDNIKTIKNIISISKIGSYYFLISLFGVVLCSLGNYGLSLVLGLISQEGLNQVTSATFDLNTLLNFVLLALLLVPVFIIGQSLNLVGGLNAEKRLKHTMINHSLHEQTTNISKDHSGSFMTLYTSDAGVVENYYFQGLNYMFLNPLISGLAALITTLLIDFRFAILSIIFGLLSIIVSAHYTKKSQSAYTKARNKDQIATTKASDIISNDLMIRQYAIEDKVLLEYKQKNNDYRKAIINAENIKHLVSFNQSLINSISMLSFLLLAYYLATYSDFNFSSVMLLLPLRGSISNMFLSLGTSWNFLLEVSISADRILAYLNTPLEDQRTNLPSLKYNNNNSEVITFDQVNFTYDDYQVLHNLNLTINSGTSTALVGTSGSGKSTIFKLLSGLYDKYSGIITVGGQDISKHNLHSLRSMIVTVEQEASLFNKSIYDNVKLGANDESKVTLDDVISACKKAAIHDFIMSLEHGYDTIVGEDGSNLSGGQRQRIAISRALMSNAPIVIMDEPTAALDSESELLIQQAIYNIAKERTILVNAHRLSTIKNMDNIVVLDKGVIKEQGNHNQLVELNGLYNGFLLNQVNE